MDVSVVIPAYNEQENLPILLPKVDQVLRSLGRSYEILVIDDASTDDTRRVLQELAGRYPAVVPLGLKKNSGQSAAFDCGFRTARGEVVVTMDADLQNDPADIPKLLEKIGPFDCVCGRRMNRQDTWTKKLTSKVANWVRNRATGETIRDTGCSLKAFRRQALARLKMFHGMHRFLPTLVRLDGYTVTEVPVTHHPRVHGKSKYNIFNRGIRPTMDLLAVMWMKRRTVPYEVRELEPLDVATEPTKTESTSTDEGA